MRPAGLLLVVVGIWVTTQVFAGNALQRMGVLPKAAASGGGGPSLPGKDDVMPYLPGGDKNPIIPKIPGLGGDQGWIKPL